VAREVRWRLVLDASGFTGVADQAAKKWQQFATGAITAAGAIKVVTDALKAQAAQEDAINKLNLALANQGKFSEATSKSLVDYSAALQDASVYADEVILGGEALLASFGMNEAQIKQTTQAAIDFSSATKTDLTTAVNLLGKAFVGNTAALGRYGIVVDQTASKSQKFESALAQLQSRFGGAALAETQTYTGGMKQLENAWGDAQEALGKFLGELSGGGAPFSVAINAAKALATFFAVDLVIALSEVRAKMLEFMAVIVDSPRFFGGLLTVMEKFGAPRSGLLHDLINGGKESAKALREQAAQVREAGTQAAMAAGKTQTFANSLNPVKVGATEAGKAVKLMNAHVEEYYKNLDEMARDVMGAPLKNLGDLGAMTGGGGKAKASFHWDFGVDALEDAAEKAAKAEKKFLDLADAASAINHAFGDFLTGGFVGLANLNNEAIQAADKWEKLAGAIKGAVSAYNAGKAAGSPGKGAMAGAGKGAAAGSAFGPYGMAIGAIVGAGIGFFGGKKAQAKELAELGAELRRLQEEARKAGVTLTHAFNPRNAQSMKTAIDELNRALGLQSDAQNALKDAMDRYGISIGQLGPEFAKQELDKKAAQLIQDYQILNAVGVAQNDIIKAMGPNLQEYVNMAVQSGTAIPESMRPIIQAMIDQGLLLDQNGQAYTSVGQAGLSFTATMTEQFGTLISKINELVSALLGIPNINRTVTVNTVRTGGEGRGDDGGRDGDPETPLAGGFEGMVNRPRRFLVGEAGPEYMSVRKPGDKGGFDLGGLETKLDGLRDDFRRYQQAQAGSIRDAVLLGRA
jgi:hypothetical protein